MNTTLPAITPGAWAMSRDATPEWQTQITVYAETGGQRIATVFSKADAVLVSVAPELLKALKGLVEAYGADVCHCCDPHIPKHCPCCIARAEIARAEDLT